MNPREEGFLLLTSHLGDPERPVLTAAQMRQLARRVQTAVRESEDRDLTANDLIQIGYSLEDAQRILALMGQRLQVRRYIDQAATYNCVPITRATGHYPELLHTRLGQDSPGCLWAKGDLAILDGPAISVVGSRELDLANLEFARCVGQLAAQNKLTLISGNARGADTAAQNSCLDAGGQVISIVADALWKYPLRQNVLYLSEEDYDMGFSSQRAHSRNRCIHAMGQTVFVAQSHFKKGGTWAGTTRNLRAGWSHVICFQDGSEASDALRMLGARLAALHELPGIFSKLENV